MRRHLSVFMLAAGSTLHKVLAIFLLMAGAEAALFCLLLRKLSDGEIIGLEQMVTQSGIPLVCCAGFLLLCAVLSFNGCERGSRLGYTIQRLSVREEVALLWWAGYNAVCFFALWAVQMVIALLMCRLYVEGADPSYVSGQTVFLAFYRNSFLHSLLPLEEGSRYIRNALLILSLGITSACFSYMQRHGRKGVAIMGLAAVTVMAFPASMGRFGGDLLTAVIALAVSAGAISNVREVRKNEN